MGRLIEWNDKDKFRKRVADVLNISEVVKDGQTLSDSDGVVDLSFLSLMQRDIDFILEYIGSSRYWQVAPTGEYLTDSDGNRFEFL